MRIYRRKYKRRNTLAILQTILISELTIISGIVIALKILHLI
jgi:hypothetical protein